MSMFTFASHYTLHGSVCGFCSTLTFCKTLVGHNLPSYLRGPRVRCAAHFEKRADLPPCPNGAQPNSLRGPGIHDDSNAGECSCLPLPHSIGSKLRSVYLIAH